MRQKTRRTALGMFLRGLAASPAATATISTPPYENAALTSVDQRPVNRPVLPVPTYSFIAPSFQYLKPLRSWSGPPPSMMIKPTRSRPRIVRILIDANMNSASPYIETAKIFRKRMMAMTMVIHTAGLILGNKVSNCSICIILCTTHFSSWSQNLIRTAAAEISTQSVIELLYQLFQPTAKPRAGSAYRAAY